MSDGYLKRGHYPRSGVSMGGGVVPISDFIRLAVMQILI